MNNSKVPPPIVKEVKLEAKAMWYLRNISATATMQRVFMWIGVIIFVVYIVCVGSSK